MSIGLSDAEATIYLTLLELGSTTAGPVIKKTGFHRATTYQVIQRLIEKGLVNYAVIGKNRKFSAAEPAKFMDLLKEKETALKKIIPSLELKNRMSGMPPQTAIVYEGNEGLKTIFEDAQRILEEGDEYLLMGAGDVPAQWVAYFERMNTRLLEKGAKRRILANEKSARSIAESRSKGYEVRIIPEELFVPVSINIFKQKTAMILWNEKPSGFVVESEALTKSFRSYFEMLWRTAKKLEKQ